MLLFPFVRVLGSVGRVLFSSHALLSKHAIICFGLNMICNAQKGRKWSFSLQQEEHLPTEHLLVIIWRPPSARGQEANIWSRIQVTFASYLRVFSFALWKKKKSGRPPVMGGRLIHNLFYFTFIRGWRRAVMAAVVGLCQLDEAHRSSPENREKHWR